MCVYLCLRDSEGERECGCVCVCEKERENERESACVCVCSAELMYGPLSLQLAM